MYNESKILKHHHIQRELEQVLDSNHGLLRGSQNPSLALPSKGEGYDGQRDFQSRHESPQVGSGLQLAVAKERSGVQLPSSKDAETGATKGPKLSSEVAAVSLPSGSELSSSDNTPKLNPLATEFVPSGSGSVLPPSRQEAQSASGKLSLGGPYHTVGSGVSQLGEDKRESERGSDIASHQLASQQDQLAEARAKAGPSSSAGRPLLPRHPSDSDEHEAASPPSNAQGHIRSAGNHGKGGGRGRGGNRGGSQAGESRGGLSAALGESRAGQGSGATFTRHGPSGTISQHAGLTPFSSNLSARPAGNHFASHGVVHSGNKNGLGVSRGSARETFVHGYGSGSSNGPSGTTPPGRKGNGSQNANHLLNFRYEPIQRATAGRGRGAYSKRQSRPPPPFNKELFLQANFRFLVSDLGDYGQHVVDPDETLDWHQVAAVEVEEPSCPQCPICLEAPALCPQITACGHMFCFPCIVRYLVMGEDDRKEHWKKCPLCFATIGTRDLRSVKIHVATPPSPGDTLRFSLLARAKNSIIPFDSSVLTDPAASINALPYSETGQCHRFAKFTLTSVDGAEKAASAIEAELMEWAAEAQSSGHVEDSDRVPYVLAAVEFLHERKRAWAKHRADDFMSSSPPVQKRIMAQSKIGAAHLGSGKEQDVTGAAQEQKQDGRAGKSSARMPRSFAESVGGGVQGRQLAATAPASKQATDVSAETDAAMARLIEEASWVYESAFSDDEEGPNGALSKQRAKSKAGGKRGKERLPVGGSEVGTGAWPLLQEKAARKGTGKEPALTGTGGGSASPKPAVRASRARGAAGETETDRDWDEVASAEGAASTTPPEGGAPLQLSGPDFGTSPGRSPEGQAEEKGEMKDQDARAIGAAGKLAAGASSGSPAGLAVLPDASGAGLAAAVDGDGRKGAQKEAEERGYYMFYQAQDGRPLILHTVSMKCLLQHSGGYENLPPSLEATVLEVNPETQTDVSRKRLKFLNHLPLTATFSLVEVDVAKLVPPSATAPFMEELRQRAQRRHRRMHQELEERARAERDAVVPKGPQPPTPADFAAILSAMNGEDVPGTLAFPDPDQSDASPPPSGAVEQTDTQSRLLFSRVTKMGYASGLNAPELTPVGGGSGSGELGLASRGVTDVTPAGSPPVRGVWGTPLRGSGQSAGSSLAVSPTSPWEAQAVPGEGIASFSAIMQAADRVKVDTVEDSPKGTKKKGKKGVTLLMSTSVRRG